MEITKEIRDALKDKGQVKVTFRINYMLYLKIMEICENKHTSISEYIRQVISNDIKHPEYKEIDNLINNLKEFFI